MANGDDFVSIPGATSTIGLTADQARALALANAGLGLTAERVSDELPAHTSEVPGFELGRAPVTCAQYQRFLDAGGYADLRLFAELISEHGGHARALLAAFVDRDRRPGPSTWSAGRPPAGQAEHPVHGVSYYEAAAYAAWAGGRLPREEEWEHAARHPDGRLFPWGDGLPERQIANFRWNKRGTTSPIGSFPAGTSALGLVDLAGNVHEWTATPYRPYPGGVLRLRFAATARARVARGGAYAGDLWDLRTTSRFAVEPELRFAGLGLRLAR